MLHKFFEPGDWFRPKAYGFGSGLPIAWQGWVLMLGYIALCVGIAVMAKAGGLAVLAAIALMTGATAIFVVVVHRRTRGGWRWRWGEWD